MGIDIRLVLKTGVCPAIHGGMFNHEGGLIGAGMARVPMECFQKAMKAFAPNTGINHQNAAAPDHFEKALWVFHS